MTEEERFEELLESDQTDPEIQYQIGCCYLRGMGVEQDGRQADRWLRRAADQGHPAARELLSAQAEEPEQAAGELTDETLPDWCMAAEEGDAEAQYRVALYFLTQDMEGGKTDADRYLSMAVDQGHPQACLTLAKERLEQGAQEKAATLLRNAADCGLPEAMGLLAECYGHGRGVEQDLKEAERWFTRCADLGSGEDKLALALRYKAGNLVPVSPARALSWLRRAQEAGVEDAEDRFYAEERVREERCQKLLQSGEGAAYGEAVRILDGQIEADLPLALRLLEELARRGSAKGQRGLGYCYGSGQGVEQDYVQAVEWHRKAAEQGDKYSQCNLGVCYCNGWGVEQDYALATEWFRKAAEQGDAKAQSNLGYCYKSGQGVEQDYALAAEWYRKAAEQGDAKAQSNLGYCYESGRGVEQDYALAAEWYRKAAEQGDAKAQSNLGYCYESGRGVEQDYTLAAEWYRKAAEQGDAKALLNLGRCYANGQGVEQDDVQAAAWYRKAAEQGDMDAQCELGYRYHWGQGVEEDDAQAAMWLRKAAEQGHARAQCFLGFYCMNGTQAVEWIRKAAEQGYADAQNFLGQCYASGRNNVGQDWVQAAEWYRRAAEQGNADAQYELGRCYENGWGVVLDLAQTAEWYQKAADQGYPQAVEHLRGLDERQQWALEQEEQRKQREREEREQHERLRVKQYIDKLPNPFNAVFLWGAMLLAKWLGHNALSTYGSPNFWESLAGLAYFGLELFLPFTLLAGTARTTFRYLFPPDKPEGCAGQIRKEMRFLLILEWFLTILYVVIYLVLPNV